MSSKQQQKLLAEIKRLAPNLVFIEDYRPDFMINLDTGKNFEIDIYCEWLKFGFEYQGMVHFKDLYRYKNDSDKSRKSDTTKHDIIDKIRGKLSVIEIFEYDLHGDVQKNICNRILNTANYYKTKGSYKCNFLYNLYLGFKYTIGFGFKASLGKITIYSEDKTHIKLSNELRSEKIELCYLRKKPKYKQLPYKRPPHERIK